MGTIFSIIIAIVCAYICCKIAEACESNKLIACILGAIFNIFAVGGYCIYMYIINRKN